MAMSLPFTQVPLSPAQLERGLAAYAKEDVPAVPLRMIAAEPSDLEARWGIHFADSFDNLDYVKVAVLQMSSGPRLTLLRHRGNPTPGTELCAVDTGEASAKAVSELTRALGLEGADLLWQHSR